MILFSAAMQRVLVFALVLLIQVPSFGFPSPLPSFLS